MNTKLDIVYQITREAQNAWDTLPDRINEFPAFAQTLLEKINLKEFLDTTLIESVLSTKLPTQYYNANEFSDFPICIASEKDVFTDLYFWSHADTSIHNHSFVGAFGVLTGEIHQTKFNFTLKERVFDWLSIGECRPIHQEVLKVGRVQKISFQDDFIHQSIHVHSPDTHTVTICLRTRHLPDCNLSSYTLPSIKMKGQFLSQENQKKMDGILYLFQRDPEQYKSTILRIIDSFSLETKVSILNLTVLPGRTIPTKFLDLLLNHLRLLHGDEAWFQEYIRAREFSSAVLAKMRLL